MRRVFPCGRVAVCIGALLSVAACGVAPSDPEALLVADIRATYASFFAENQFAYVVLTYPESVQALPAAKRLEFDTVQRLLDELRIDSTQVRHGDAMVKFKGAKRDRDYVGYYLAEHVAARLRNKIVLFLNFHAGDVPRGTVHPHFAKNNVDVRVATDPVEFAYQ